MGSVSLFFVSFVPLWLTLHPRPGPRRLQASYNEDMRVIAAAGVLCAVLAGPTVDAQAPAPAPGISAAAAAESLARKLTSIEARKREKVRKAQTVEVTEHELNSYLNLKLGTDMPTGITDVRVSLQRER